MSPTSVTSGFWMASSKRSSAEPLPARTTCRTPRTARASEAGGVPRRLKHGRRYPSPSNDIRGKYLERQPRRSRPSPRGLAATEMLRDQYVQRAAHAAGRTLGADDVRDRGHRDGEPRAAHRALVPGGKLDHLDDNLETGVVQRDYRCRNSICCVPAFPVNQLAGPVATGTY